MDKIFRDKKAILIFITPALVLFTAVLLIPIVMVLYYSFFDWSMAAKDSGEFIGFKNYIKLFTNDEVMKTSLKNSIFFMLFSAVTQQIIGLFLAVLLSNIKKGRNFFKNIYYMPSVLSSAALGLLWYFLLSDKFGINRFLLDTFSIQAPQWLSEREGFIILPMWVIGCVATWQYVGQTMMLYMAQITGISPSLYEAAYIDGCNKTKAFRYITLPLIRPMVATSLSITCIGSLKFFDLIWTMTGGGKPSDMTMVVATHLYREGFRYQKRGYASAIGISLLGLSLLITFIINKSIKVEEYEM